MPVCKKKMSMPSMLEHKKESQSQESPWDSQEESLDGRAKPTANWNLRSKTGLRFYSHEFF